MKTRKKAHQSKQLINKRKNYSEKNTRKNNRSYSYHDKILPSTSSSSSSTTSPSFTLVFHKNENGTVKCNRMWVKASRRFVNLTTTKNSNPTHYPTTTPERNINKPRTDDNTYTSISSIRKTLTEMESQELITSEDKTKLELEFINEKKYNHWTRKIDLFTLIELYHEGANKNLIQLFLKEKFPWISN